MRNLVRLSLTASMAMMLAGNTGCMFAAKRAFKEAKGASSKPRTFPDSPKETYKGYKGVTIGTLDSDVTPFVSREFMSALRNQLSQQLSRGKEAIFPGGEPSITVSAKVLWYHEAGGAGGILGSDSFAIVLYTISDGGREIDHIQMMTKSAASRTGDDDMAKSSVEGLVKWFQRHKEGKFDDVEDEKEEKQKEKEKEKRRREEERDRNRG